MFQFRRFPSIRYGLAYGYMRSSHVGFPIRISPDQWIFAPPRSFSQLVTSFIGSQCLGIHPAPFMLDHYGLPSAIALASGFFLMNCSAPLIAFGMRLPDSFHPLLRTSLLWSFLVYNVTFVTPRMSFLSLCVLRLDIDCCICGFQGTSPDGIIRRDGSLLPGPSGFFPADSVPARERMSSCS